MTKYKAKSMLVSRIKNYNKEEHEMYPYNTQVKFFKINNPHKTIKMPFKILEFRALSCYLKNFKVAKFLPWGNDLLFNDLKEVKVEFVDERLHITDLSK